MENEILRTLHYFSFFSYPPTAEEIHRFLKKRAEKRQTIAILEKMVKKAAVTIYNGPTSPRRLEASLGARYTLGEYSIKKRNFQFPISNFQSREKISRKKVKKISPYVKFLAKFPQIRLIGLSGSAAMSNADENHDVDLFIITARERLWTGRFIALLLASLFRLRRKRTEENVGDKICLNLFFDESNLAVPKFKQTEYVAHEVLQMKPMTSKNGVYEAFLRQNNWVYKIFPNANDQLPITNVQSMTNYQLPMSNLVGDAFEFLFKILELSIIKLHQTTEIVTDSQLWFHPDDFEKKLKNIR